MTAHTSISISDYTYELPDERIAKHPLENRDESKLLTYKDGVISDDQFSNIAHLIDPGTLMVFNNTKVIHARLAFQRETGAAIEILCLEPYSQPDVQTALTAKGTSMWKAFVGNAKKWKQGERLTSIIPYASGEIKLSAMMLNRADDAFMVGLFWEPFELSLAEVLHEAGTLPLPPYLKREHVPQDEDRYQTVYAQHNGSVAAPTAGLHFTFETLDKIAENGIGICDVTLHVGAGTFKPVKTDAVNDHVMHEEMMVVSLESLILLRDQLLVGKPIAAVGTTVTRTLESIYWHGVQLIQGKNSNHINIHQWDPYQLKADGISNIDALNKIIQVMEANQMSQLTGYTALLILPGYQFRMIDVLVTNFHQPESTLLLLIAAFIGPDWKKVYEHALNNNYRFLSYGDSSILFKVKNH